MEGGGGCPAPSATEEVGTVSQEGEESRLVVQAAWVVVVGALAVAVAVWVVGVASWVVGGAPVARSSKEEPRAVAFRWSC